MSSAHRELAFLKALTPTLPSQLFTQGIQMMRKMLVCGSLTLGEQRNKDCSELSHAALEEQQEHLPVE